MARRGSMGRRDSGDRDEGRGRGRDRNESRGRGRGRDRDDGRGSRRGGGFRYRERDAGAAKSRAEGGSDRIGFLIEGLNRWSPSKGANRIRILPPTWEGANHFGFDVYAHYSVGPENASVLSLHKMKDEDDPIWEEYSKAESDGDEDYAKELRPKHRVGYWLIDRDDEKKGPQLWLAPYATIDRELSKQMIDSRTGEVLLIDHPEDGYDVEFDKSGEKERTKYEGVRIARQSTDIGRDAGEWLEYVEDNPIPDCLVYSTYDEIANIFHARGGTGRNGSDRGGGRDRGRGDSDGDKGRGKSGPTEREVNRMSFEELDDLIMEERLDIDGQEFDKEEELADAIIKELGLGERPSQTERGRGRGRPDDDDRALDRMERGSGRGRGRGRGGRDEDIPF